MQNGTRNGSAGESLERVATLTSTLVRQEIALAQAEIGEAASAAAMGLALLATAALLGITGLVLLIVTVVLGLATAVPAWLAALLVGIAVLLIGQGSRCTAGRCCVESRPSRRRRSSS